MQPFVLRRNRLQKNLKSSDAFLILQPPLIVRNSDVHYPHHPNRYFYYLTGFDEPNACILITPDKTLLWSEPDNEKHTLWSGPVLAQKATNELEVDSWNSIQNIESLTNQLKNIENLFIVGKLPSEIVFSGKKIDGAPLIDHMRIIKDQYEIDVISKSCYIASLAHNHMMENAKKSKHETELLGYFIQKIMSEGSKSLAYDPIVASGKNALTLHYIKNNSPIHPKDLVLVDAGCEYQQYASDISRTFPANGKFSKDQQALYEACLDVQQSTIEQIVPGISLNKLHETAVLRLTQHLVDLKLIKSSLDNAINQQSFQKFFPHRIGHTLGLDVHDIPPLDQILRPGMVITIEPGIYVRTPGKFQNMGIRIEDNILITEYGHKNLTEKAAKSVKDIQKLMQS